MLSLSVFLMLLLSLTEGATQNITFPVMGKVSRRETPVLPPPYLHLPVSVDSKLPLVKKEFFSPAKGTGQEPLPKPVREILLPVRLNTSPPSTSGLSVKTSCRLRKMHVQVPRSVLGAGDLRFQVKLGSCPASKFTTDYLYFEYGLDMCGTKRTAMNNQVAYSNLLQYEPPNLQGPIRRAAPFSLPITCYYNRYLYSYKIGYKPKMRMRKIPIEMRNGSKITLTPRNAQWERLSPSDQYMLGKPMYFQAEAFSAAHGERLYIQWCYVTPEKSYGSTPQFPVVKNFGCMIESKHNRSRFIPHKISVVRFSVDAFSFKGMTGQRLYMHCSMSVGPSTPTSTAKSCNYDQKERRLETFFEIMRKTLWHNSHVFIPVFFFFFRWAELYGSYSVCSCCESDCSSDASMETQIISSRSWKIQHKARSMTKKKAFSTTTTTTTTTTPTATATTTTTTTTQPKTPTAATDRWKPPQTAATPASETGCRVKESEWSLRGRGVTRFDVEGEEKRAKGSAVVEEEEEKEEEEVAFIVPRTMFEEIFDFDK
ncbi:uncharacterized protein V6R79_007757 [Siganus canaliculatus]